MLVASGDDSPNDQQGEVLNHGKSQPRSYPTSKLPHKALRDFCKAFRDKPMVSEAGDSHLPKIESRVYCLPNVKKQRDFVSDCTKFDKLVHEFMAI